MAKLDVEDDDPQAVAETVALLVKQSLQPEVREQLAQDEELLSRLGDLLELHLARLAGFRPDGKGGMCLQPEMPLLESLEPVEMAAAACLKLARNLAAGNKEIQGRWWRRGLLERLAVQSRSDLAKPGEGRSAQWCEAVPTLMANIVANNKELRDQALEALWPHGLAAVLALCYRRPDHGFLLLQNLFQGHHPQLMENACVLHMIVSLLRVDESELGPDTALKARDWASIFFSGLWAEGLFVPIFAAIKSLTAKELHNFLSAAAAVPGWGAGPRDSCESFGRVMARMCGRKEALGLLWHTVRGLLGGLESEQGGVSASSPEPMRLAQDLLKSDGFVELASREMAEAILCEAARWNLRLDPRPPCAAVGLGLQNSDLDLAALAAEGSGEADTPVDGDAQVGSGSFREMLMAMVELAAMPCGTFPPKLAGLYLWGNVKLISALHHLRFGQAAVAETGAPLPARQDPKDAAAAVEAAKACELVAQLRLCGNVLFENPEAAEFLRISGGLPTLLSHCYADPELPLLREAGVYAVRNATKHSLETQEAVRQLLSERRTRDSGPLPMIEESALFA